LSILFSGRNFEVKVSAMENKVYFQAAPEAVSSYQGQFKTLHLKFCSG
jgi:hypothetical protein